MRIPRGDGRKVRLPRGATLTDFAEKIDANPGALVQALISLGEMATATQSLSDDTLMLLGSELNFAVEVVSPRTRTANCWRVSTWSSARTRVVRGPSSNARRW